MTEPMLIRPDRLHEVDDFGIWCEPPREDLRVTQARWDAEEGEGSLIERWRIFLRCHRAEARRIPLGTAVLGGSLLVWTVGLWAIFG